MQIGRYPVVPLKFEYLYHARCPVSINAGLGDAGFVISGSGLVVPNATKVLWGGWIGMLHMVSRNELR